MEMILCIPRMPANITKSYIFQSLCRLKWGHISIMNEIPLRNDPTQKRVLFRVRWGGSGNAEEYKKKIQNGNDIKVVHDITSPYFWKILANREPTKKQTLDKNTRWVHQSLEEKN